RALPIPPPHHPHTPFLYHAPPPTALYTLSLHDALPICPLPKQPFPKRPNSCYPAKRAVPEQLRRAIPRRSGRPPRSRRKGRKRLDRKSTRLNSSHQIISYAVFCLKKKKKQIPTHKPTRR